MITLKQISIPKRIIYLAVLLLVNVCYYTLDVPYHTAASWISYLFLHLAFLAMVFVPLLVVPGIHVKQSERTLQVLSGFYFLAEVLAVLLFTVVVPFYWQLALILQLTMLVVLLVLVFGSRAADLHTEKIEERKKEKQSYLRECCAVVEEVLQETKDPVMRKKVKQLYDLIHASPTGSTEKLWKMEEEILQELEQLQPLLQDEETFGKKVQEVQGRFIVRNQILKNMH